MDETVKVDPIDAGEFVKTVCEFCRGTGGHEVEGEECEACHGFGWQGGALAPGELERLRTLTPREAAAVELAEATDKADVLENVYLDTPMGTDAETVAKREWIAAVDATGDALLRFRALSAPPDGGPK